MRILTIDIETSPHLSWHWGRWQQNIRPEQTVEESRMICFAAKWADKRKTYFLSEWGCGRDKMLAGLHALLDEADVVVGFNSNKFDLKRINSELLLGGFKPPSPYHKVDLMLQAKKNFGFSSNKLKHILKALGLSPKLEDDVNFDLWVDVLRGQRKAQRTMEKYNRQDVISTEELYDYILGWISPHPNWGLYVDDLGSERPTCPNCGGSRMVRSKIRTTRVRRYHQWRCKDCGKYSRGRKHIDGKAQDDSGILT